MFLIALIILLILMILSTLKIVKRQKTGEMSWGEPFVTIFQIILMVAMVICMSMSMAAA